MDKITQTYIDMHERDDEELNETYTNECEVEDPIFEIIEQVGEKYKKTWEELSK